MKGRRLAARRVSKLQKDDSIPEFEFRGRLTVSTSSSPSENSSNFSTSSTSFLSLYRWRGFHRLHRLPLPPLQRAALSLPLAILIPPPGLRCCACELGTWDEAQAEDDLFEEEEHLPLPHKDAVRKIATSAPLL